MRNKIFDYTKTERFAVVRKLEKNRRYYCNFKVLHETREEAETVALKMANEVGGQYYVVELQRITNFSYVDVVATKKSTDIVRVVEDVKGVRTPLYRLKKRMMKAFYGIEVQEI